MRLNGSNFGICSTFLRAFFVFASLGCPTSVFAQAMGGMGGGGPPGGGAPAFAEEKFRDRVWESGGPRIASTNGGKMILRVEVYGNKTVTDHRILSHMQTRPDRLFDDKVLQADLRELYRTELFETIRYSTMDEGEGIVLRLEIRERPIATEVVFHGNKGIDEGQLKKHCGLQKGDPISPSGVEMARRRLIDLYKENAFNQIDIQTRNGNKPGDRQVFFEISEGPLERIWNIRFEGNAFASDALLKARIKCKDAKYGITTYIANKAVISTIEEDKELLGEYYRSLGFFQARVGYRLDYHDSGKFVDVTFVINEGIRFKMRNISIVGNRYHETNELLGLLKMESDEYFNLGKMSRDIRTLKEVYGAQGFVFVNVEAEPRYLEEPGMMDMVYRIEEGDRYRAGDIRVHLEGDSSHTKHQIALNYMGRVRPGSMIDMREVQSAERRLGSSQIFDTRQTGGEDPRIEIQPPDKDDPENRP